MKNGEILKDRDGNVLHAHGGCVIKVVEYYYWYGENRTSNNYVSCYKTKDFKTFDFCNNVLTSNSLVLNNNHGYITDLLTPVKGNEEEIKRRTHIRYFSNEYVYINIERPKVVYCEKTKKYVMWMHYENGITYRVASCAVAICDTPDGDFTFVGAFRPFGNMSRDCTLFNYKGKEYFISAGNNNKDLYLYQLSDDFLNVENSLKLFEGEFREAPALFVNNEKLYLISSYCTGWDPNQGKYSVCLSEDLTKWSSLKNFGDETTYHSQPACTFELNGKRIYLGDRWDGVDYYNSSYVMLEIQFDNEDNPYIEYCEKYF